MLILVSLVLALGLMPLIVAAVRLKSAARGMTSWPPLGSLLLATLAFNLTFFWQELWLVIPKAMTPGLSPVLYHNNHDWTGSSPVVELLQGTGAIATMVSGLSFTALLALARTRSSTWQAFVFWMAFQGMFQSLSQFAIGSVIPGNDVGRAFGYLGFGEIARTAVMAATVAALFFFGRVLASLAPASLAPRSALGTRGHAWTLVTTAAALVLLSVVFRIPRNWVEVLMIPAIVNLIGIAWLLLGTTRAMRAPNAPNPADAEPPAIVVPAIALVALLIFFQTILRAGVRI